MATVRELLLSGDELPGDSARRDAEVLLGHCLGQSRSWLYTWPEREVSADQADRYSKLLDRRKTGYPVAYLLGVREFWSLPIRVNRHTLIPRPETETLVSLALQLDLPATARVLDLGTGSGAISLALASERPDWRVWGVDSSEGALEMARHNADRLGLGRVRFTRSDWYGAVAGQRFHLLVSNPPYIDAGDHHLREGDVRFEPRPALVATDSGLADLARVAAGAPAHLYPSGWLLLEHGCDQGEAVRALLRENGFAQVATHNDLAGLERISGGTAVLTDEQLLRYNRQLLINDFDIAGQERLLQASVLVVGLGGLGCPAALYLAAAGIGTLLLADGDAVETSNLQRQIAHGDADIGRNKAVSAAAAIAAINPGVALEVIPRQLAEADLASLVRRVDLVVDATDNYPVRFALNRACIADAVPLVSAAAVRSEGQISVFDPARGGPCYRCLYPDTADVTALSCGESGVLAPLVGVLGSLQAMEALKILAGYGEPLRGSLLLLDLRSMDIRQLALPARADCPDCAHLQG